MSTKPTTSQGKSKPKSDRLVVWTFVGLALLLNVVVLYFGPTPGNADTKFIFEVLTGVFCAELCAIALLSGLTGRTWLGGFTRGLGIAVLWYLAAVSGYVIKILLTDELGGWPGERIAAIENLVVTPLVGICLVPWLLLILSSPLIGLRLCGWRLVHKDAIPSPRYRFRIADLFAGTVAVATTLTLVRVPGAIWEMPPDHYWIRVLVVSGVFFAIGLLVVPLLVCLALGGTRRSRALMGTGAMMIATYLLIAAISQFFYKWSDGWEVRISEALLPIAINIGSAAIVLCMFLFFYSRSGMLLIRGKQEVPAVMVASLSERPRTRWQIVALIVVAACVNIGLARLDSWRRQRDQEIEGLGRIATRLGGDLAVDGRRVFRLSLGEQTTDLDVERFASSGSCQRLYALNLRSPNLTDKSLESISQLRSLRNLNLIGTPITDKGLADIARLRNLVGLQLSGAPISDDCLGKIASLENLYDLNLSNTPISGKGLAQIVGRTTLRNLNLDQTQISDADCSVLAKFRSVTDLSLAGTAVTDAGIQQLSELSQLSTLNLFRTAVDGSGLQRFNQLQFLDLGNTNLNDETIQSLANLTELISLQMANTKITDQSLTHLTKLQKLKLLDLSGTQVTDAGVSTLRSLPPLSELNLSRTSITGECFRNWPQPSPGLNLNLTETNVADASLPIIAKLSPGILSIRGSKITANGLLTAGFSSPPTLTAGKGQFTEAEILRLEKRFEVRLEGADSETAP